MGLTPSDNPADHGVAVGRDYAARHQISQMRDTE